MGNLFGGVNIFVQLGGVNIMTTIIVNVIINNSIIFTIITTITYFFIWSDSSPLVGAFTGTLPTTGLFADSG